MPHPQRKYDDDSGDLRLPGDDEPEELGDAEPKPDWLLSAEHPVEAFQPDEEGPASGPVLKRPGAGVPSPGQAASRPRLVPNPQIPSPADAGRLEGLVGPELPAGSPQTRLPDRTEQLGMNAQARAIPLPQRPAHSEGAAGARADSQSGESPVPTWAAVTSSIPTMRVQEDAEEPEVVVVADEEEWEEPQEEAKPAPASRVAKAARPAPPPEPTLPFPVPAALVGPLSAVVGVIGPILRDHGRSIAILSGCVVVLIIVLNFALPKEPMTSVRDVIRDAASLDGKEVRIRGVIGQWFPMGEGYSFYLHQGRDTIVVFTRARTPQEKQKVKVLGTVSTGFLDGRPRPTIFETRLD